MKIRLAAAIAVALAMLCAPSFGQKLSETELSAAEQAMNAIRPEAIRAHMRFLSDSLLEGRGTGTRGYEIAAYYVATELESMGLQPAGINHTWFQPVPLRKIELAPQQSSFALVGHEKETRLVDGEDYVMPGSPLYEDVSVEAPVVFVGFGVTAPEFQYDDYAGIDVHGKIVASLWGGPARFPPTQRAYFADNLVKARNAVAHGAVGMIRLMLPEDQKRYAWKWLVPQVKAGSMRWLDDQGVPNDSFPELRGGGLLSQKGAELLFAGAPESLDQAFAAARNSQPQAFALPTKAKIHTVSRLTRVESRNIVAEMRGSDPKLRDQYVVYTAHVDHLGLCSPVEGDNVCHGAFDNASGTSDVLEVARGFASLPQPPRRSILFAFVTGEELGLLGSDYFAHYPTVPRAQIVANINIDCAPGILYPLKDIVPLGAEHSSLSENVRLAAIRLGYDISPDPWPEEVFFIRSDQYSFVRQGVPAVAIAGGSKSTDPKLDGNTILKRWLTSIYHTPRDNMNQPFDFESAAKAARLNFLVGFEVGEQALPPAWNAGDFFGGKFAQKHAAAGVGER